MDGSCVHVAEVARLVVACGRSIDVRVHTARRIGTAQRCAVFPRLHVGSSVNSYPHRVHVVNIIRACRGRVAELGPRMSNTLHTAARGVPLPEVWKSLASSAPVSIRNVVLFEVEHGP
jgi:hypothetical protein